MKATTPAKLIPPDHSTAASGTLPIEQTKLRIAISGPGDDVLDRLHERRGVGDEEDVEEDRRRLLLAGFIALLGDDFFNVLFITNAPPLVQTIENVVAGPLIAILSFVCSIGKRAAGGGAVVGRDQLRRGRRLHLRRPRRAADRALLPQYYGTAFRAADHRA